MPTTLVERRKQYRIIFEALFGTPRIMIKDISALFGGKKRANSRLREAFALQYIVGPEARTRSHRNLGEYMYFLNCEDPEGTYEKYREDKRVSYHAEMSGFSNVWIISKDRIDVDEEIIFQGWRSDYHISFPPDRTSEQAVQVMRKKVEDFDPKKYVKKGTIQTRSNETTEWDEKDEILYQYFKYDLRRKFSPVIKKYNISTTRLYEWLKRLPECCTVFTSFFPERMSNYGTYLFMCETDYEDFIIELLSELPTTSTFFKVADRLFAYLHLPRFAYLHLPRSFVRTTDLKASAEKLTIPFLVIELSRKGIIKNKGHASVEYSLAKEL